nr:immunoglobulin light chain junction region [Macaca mulatta]
DFYCSTYAGSGTYIF